jgi:hypothetical protein
MPMLHQQAFKAITLVLLLIFSGVSASAMSIVIPDCDKLIDESNAIVIGKFKNASDNVFVVEEILKETNKLDKELLVYSDLSWIFNLDDWENKLSGKKVIFFGNWIPQYKVITPACIQYSFWPQGPPPAYLPTTDFNKLKRYILNRLKMYPQHLTPPPDFSNCPRDAIQRLEEYIQKHRAASKP